MNALAIHNIHEQLAQAPFDPAVGIRLVPVAGDDSFAFYAAEIGPHQRVGAHYHQAGGELYQIVEGRGTMHIGLPEDGGPTRWTASAPVQAGDCFSIPEGHVHQLCNAGGQRLIALFGCPASHLTTDRTMVEGHPSP